MNRYVLVMLLAMVSSSKALPQDSVLGIYADSTYETKWRSYHLELFDRYEIAEAMRLTGAMDRWNRKPYFVYKNEPGFQTTKAMAYRVGPDGEIIRTGFVTVSGQSVFDQFVESEIDRANRNLPAGSKVVVEGTELRRILKTPDYTRAATLDDGREVMATVSTAPKHVAYSNGIMAFGGKDAGVLSLPMRRLQPLLRRIRGKMFYVSYTPRSTPAKARKKLLSAIARSAAPQMQRSDLETLGDYKLRRQGIDSSFSLLEALVLHTEECTAWSKWPRTDEEPYEAEIKLRAKRGSDLAKLIDGLRGSPVGITTEKGPEDIGLVNVNLSLPKALRSILISRIPKTLATEVQDLLRTEINRGQIRAAVRLSEDEGEPCLYGTVASEESANWIRTIGDASTSHLAQDGTAAGTNTLRVMKVDLGSISSRFVDDKNSLRFKFATARPERVNELREVSEARRQPQPLVYAQIDLKNWVTRKADSPVGKLLRQLEAVLLRTWVRPLNQHDLAIGKRHESYRLVLDQAVPDGDWSCTIRLNATGGALTLRVRLGAALHGFLRVRRTWLSRL